MDNEKAGQRRREYSQPVLVASILTCSGGQQPVLAE